MAHAEAGRSPATGVVVALTVIIGLLPASGSAQQASRTAHGVLDIPIRMTSLHGQRSTMAGAAALLGLGDRFAFGGAGWFLVGDAPLKIGSGPSALDLAVGYGGLLGEVTLARGSRTSAAIRVLIGAGNGTVSLSAVSTEIASDNFGVLEPEITGSLTLTGLLHATVGVGYRKAFGVEDLPEVAPGDFDAVSVSLGLSLRRPR